MGETFIKMGQALKPDFQVLYLQVNLPVQFKNANLHWHLDS